MNDARDVAGEVQSWIDDNWRRDIRVGQWWANLAEAGFAYPTWPVGLGGFGAGAAVARVVQTVLARNGVIAPPTGGVAAGLAAPTILAHGTDQQKTRFVRPIATGETAWCQLFSEPGSGSDLASVGTSAVRDGDEWIVSGQKVWNSAADVADFGMLLARTDLDQPKHEGITYFVIDMHQPGVEVRPLRQMNGTTSFCEVFLTEARVRPGCVIGEVNGGWSVARTTLAAERNNTAGGARRGLVTARSGSAGDLGLLVEEVLTRVKETSDEPIRIKGGAVPWRVMFDLARRYGRNGDPPVRQELVRYHAQVRINAWTMQRITEARGKLTGADGSIAKLATSRICQESRELAYLLVGAEGMLVGPESPMGGDLQVANLASPGTRIGGGTDEIQLNLLGERGLGLPREPSGDRGIPYRELKVGTQRSGR